jgi:hypothetical protein
MKARNAFAALRQALADVPPERYAGAMMITDGQVHDVPQGDAAARLRRSAARPGHRQARRDRPDNPPHPTRRASASSASTQACASSSGRREVARLQDPGAGHRGG